MNSKPKVRLLALNLALILLCSMLVMPASAYSGRRVNLGYGDRDLSGPGWSYSASDRTLTLDGYDDGTIFVTGDLAVYSLGNVRVSGGLRVYDGSLTLFNYGTLEVFGPESAISAYQNVDIILFDGEMNVSGNDSRDKQGGCGIRAANVSIMAMPKSTSDIYEGRQSPDAKINITGGNGGRFGGDAILARNVRLDADAEITGGSSSYLPGRAVALVDSGKLYYGFSWPGNSSSTPASSYSAFDATLKSGGRIAAVGGYLKALPRPGSETGNYLAQYIADSNVSPHVAWEVSSTRVTPDSLEFYTRSYTTTIDGNGGTVNGRPNQTVSGKYPARIDLGRYTFAKTDAALTGLEIGGKTVAADYSFIPTEDTQVKAIWKDSNINLDGQITFNRLKDRAVYNGTNMPLSDFAGEAAFKGDSSVQFTYTLSKDGGTARKVTLSDTVQDAGSYTLTASCRTAEGSGSKSITFTITQSVIDAAQIPGTLSLSKGNAARLTLPALPSGDYTLVSRDNNIASVSGTTVTGVETGTTVVTVTWGDGVNVARGEKAITVTVTDLPGQNLTFAESSKTVTYGDAPFTNAATNSTAGGGTVTCTSSDPKVATVNRTTGEVAIVGAGETTITATAAAVPNTFAETTASYTLTVRPKAITASASVEPKSYNGSTEAKAAVTFEGLVGNDSPEYRAEASFDTADAGTGKTVTVKITLVNAGNYTLQNETVILNDGVINKAPAQTRAKELPIRYGNTGTVTCDLKSELPGSLYTVGEAADSAEILERYHVENGVLSVQLKAGLSKDKVGSAATIPVTVTSANFEDSTITVTVCVTDQLLPTVSAEDITAVYSGSAVSDSRIRGSAVYDGQAVAGSWSFKAGQALTNVADSGVKSVIFTPADSASYAVVEDTIQVTITRATPSGRPAYTSINRPGMTLADAKLTTGSITPAGTISWNNAETTKVSQNTSYGWTFVPDDTANYSTLTGTIQPYVVYTYDNDNSSDSEPTYRVETPSRVTGGTVTVSPTNASENQRVTVTVKPQYGYELDQLTVTDKNGNELSLTDRGSGKYSFVMPKGNVNIRTTFKSSAPTQPAAATFRDVPANAYYYDAVRWAVANGITAGTGDGVFSPDANCTRGQIAAFLWRAAGQPKPTTTVNPFNDIKPTDYNYQAILWAYEKGITSGTGSNTFSPNADCTRAQLVSFLWRAEGSVAADGSTFQDVSGSAYYANAISWAVQKGITSGTGGNSFSPDAVCSRAQAVTFLYRNAMK